MDRLEKLLGHLSPPGQADELMTAAMNRSECIGEMENRQVDESNATRFSRVTLKIAFTDRSQADERYGGSGDVAILEGELLLPKTPSKTVFVFMHPYVPVRSCCAIMHAKHMYSLTHHE